MHGTIRFNNNKASQELPQEQKERSKGQWWEKASTQAIKRDKSKFKVRRNE